MIPRPSHSTTGSEDCFVSLDFENKDGQTYRQMNRRTTYVIIVITAVRVWVGLVDQ